ncbi:hypothetical protein [Sphingomonas sp.]|uniref:hypothetical protein n=1 Tax=Sphingomonas sp. TaxID=28214 RepID=UPI0038B3AE5F
MNRPSVISADTLHRVVKMALDTGEVHSLDEAYALFGRYRLSVSVDEVEAASPAGQAALLTIVNCARRALLGGVSVVGNLGVPLLLSLPGLGATVGSAVLTLGGSISEALSGEVPALILGEAPEGLSELALKVAYGGWRAGVFPADEDKTFDDEPRDVLAAMVAGALGVSEIFQNFRGNPMAARRRVGMNLWRPEVRDWDVSAPGPRGFVAPSHLWLIGLGHLGQAYLWALGLLPYARPEEVELTLQDFDSLAASNDSTSPLTNDALIGQRKTRAMAAWAELRGFRTRMIERRFAGDIVLQPDDPRVALCGVDNAAARAALEGAGFDLVVEAGLGAGPTEYLAMRLHSFPGSRPARDIWRDEGEAAATSTRHAPAYERLGEAGFDECGLVTLASRTVGAPFVGTVAAGLAIAEVLRRLNGVAGLDVLDLTLRDMNSREVVMASTELRGFNPGFTDLSS